LRGENIELPLSVPFPRNKLPNRKYVNRLKKFLTSLKRKADVYGFGLLKELTEIAIDYLDQCDLLTLKEFEGDYIQGTGICGNCSMVFVSNALSSIDSTCKFLYEYGPDWIYLPADLNYIACPFCNTKRNIDSPAMFHSFERMQTIYCITSNWIQNETQAVEVFTPIFKDIRNRYKKRLSKEQISMFNKSSVLYTYGRNQFIYAIQMGDVISEGHTYEIRRTPDGNGLLIDSAKKVSIGVPKELLVEEENEDEKSVLEKAAKLKLAIELRNSGDLIKSKDILENLIKVDPNNRIANANLALVLNDIGEKERSQEIFQNLAKNEGLGNEFLKRSSYFQRGMELADSRRYKEAIKCYDAALSFDPNYLNALDSKGYSLFRLEKYKEATACYDRVLQSAAEDSYDAVLAWTNKGAALSKLGKYEEAINCYDKAIEKEMQIYYSDDFYSHYCLVWYNNGVTLTKLGKYEEALKLFDKSLEIDAKHDKSWYWRARSKIKMGNTNEGLVDLKKAIELDLQFIKLAKQEQDFEKIRNDKRFLKLVAMNENTLVQKASKEHTDMGTRTVEQDSEWEEDVETCLNILSYMPNFAETYYGLGVTLNKFGEFEEAIKLFDRALEIDSRHAASWYGRARANIKIGNTERSLIDLKKAIELDLQFIKLAKQEQDFEKLRSVRWFAKLLTKYK
jgi:superkiller protein 3